jgi:hypothetical protein
MSPDLMVQTVPGSDAWWRNYYAAHAPFGVEDARALLRERGDFTNDDMKLIGVAQHLAIMRFAYADAMVRASREPEYPDLSDTAG